jgi:tryptophanyl-tRNA synthetase
MSKTVEGSYINLTDSLEEIKAKLAKTPTDSGKGESLPKEGGVAVLLTLIELFEGKDKKEEYEKKYLGEGIRYSELKNELAEAIFNELKPIQKRRRELEARPAYINQTLEEGARKASEVAGEALEEVKRAMGLI